MPKKDVAGERRKEGLYFDVGEELTVSELLKQWFRRAPDEDANVEVIKMLWGIWLHKNKAVYDNVIEDLARTVNLMQNLDWTYHRLSLGIHQSDCVDKSDSGWTLIDGAWHKPSCAAGAAWVRVDSKGIQLAQKQLSFFTHSAVVAEAQACLEALRWCLQSNIKAITILTDC
ncbi:hypothetical protein LOK49_LG01G01879 [Camellia lanceoleosa]|uniref:Uncharacterized protein n=1 Tax=Camellia lanceoleosa TaxID=1840588 RepID=A0ACC0J6C2_9ERIC|nr:hypothetical protein LOK49_LG01G01879 [Camellia lanceoleosa]